MQEIIFSDWKIKKYYFKKFDKKFYNKIRQRISKIKNWAILKEEYWMIFKKSQKYVKQANHYFLSVWNYNKQHKLELNFWIQSLFKSPYKQQVLYHRKYWYKEMMPYSQALAKLNQQLIDYYDFKLPAEMLVESEMLKGIDYPEPIYIDFDKPNLSQSAQLLLYLLRRHKFC